MPIPINLQTFFASSSPQIAGVMSWFFPVVLWLVGVVVAGLVLVALWNTFRDMFDRIFHKDDQYAGSVGGITFIKRVKSMDEIRSKKSIAGRERYYDPVSDKIIMK